MQYGFLQKNIVKFLTAALAVWVLLTAFLAAPGITRTQAAADTADETLIVVEGGSGERWSQLTRLNIFSNSKYDGAKIIAPMSAGEYEFTVQNSSRFPFAYTMKISDENPAGIPLLFRLQNGDGYLVGNETEWATIDGLIDITGELDRESEDAYTLEWKWTGDNDPLDTSIGIVARESGAEYVLNFNITAEQTGPAVGPETPQTGEVSHAAFALATALSALVLIVLLALVRRRGKGTHEQA